MALPRASCVKLDDSDFTYQAIIPLSLSFDLVGSMMTPSVLVL
jgi:hypothetical protein